MRGKFSILWRSEFEKNLTVFEQRGRSHTGLLCKAAACLAVPSDGCIQTDDINQEEARSFSALLKIIKQTGGHTNIADMSSAQLTAQRLESWSQIKEEGKKPRGGRQIQIISYATNAKM